MTLSSAEAGRAPARGARLRGARPWPSGGTADIAALEAEVTAIEDPWQRLETILTRSHCGYAT